MTDFEVEEGREVVGRTIVGGRPRARRQKRLRVPIGIEKVLARAAADPTFRVALFADRRAAIDDAGYEMLASELTVLESVPEGVLASMIGRIDLRRHGQRKFMRGVVAAAFASAAATSSLLGCEAASAGIAPDEVTDNASWPDMGVTTDVVEESDEGSRGIMADDPEDAAEQEVLFEELPAPGGILPDEP
jgi:hypothetical protein